ncbi:MAG: sigma-70 family RNA polymerase sigma factor [Myxococcales bacterium]|nr:sigma-70 family RNA polymerase sigma factor [Myxococcales bacterium]
MRPTQASSAPTPLLDLEGRLIDRARSGDIQAWSRLYQEHFDGIFRHILHLTGDRDLAEDLVQETFAKAMVSLPRFRGDSKLSTWLSGIAINIVRGHWRRQKSARKAHDGLVALNEVAPPNGAAPDQAGLQRARAEALYGVLSELPETLREVFVLRELEGMRAADVASQLGISEGNVNTRASRARARVRNELERLGWLQPKASASAASSKERGR